MTTKNNIQIGPKQDIGVDDNGNIISQEITTSNFVDYSAIVYYAKAKKFTDEINEKLGKYIQAEDTKLLNMPTKLGEYGKNIEYGNTAHFLNISDLNDPEDESSIFMQHKRKVIRACIEDNLNNAINSYNTQSGKNYNFKMPIIKDEDWEQIYRNVSVISFLQGIPSGLRQYNNYSVVTSTGNKEYVDPNAIYFIGDDGSYHNLNCKELSYSQIIGYKKSDFNAYRKYYNSKEFYYRYSSDKNKPEETYIPACYYCIVDSTKEANEGNIDEIKLTAYYTALARERYNLIKTTQNLK